MIFPVQKMVSVSNVVAARSFTLVRKKQIKQKARGKFVAGVNLHYVCGRNAVFIKVMKSPNLSSHNFLMTCGFHCTLFT